MFTSLSCLEGDWKAGRESSDRGLEVSPLNPILLATRVLLEHETGESAQGGVYLERLIETVCLPGGPAQLQASTRTTMGIRAIALITGVPDRLEIAEATAEAALSNTPQRTMYARAGLALLAVQKGDQSAAQTHYAYLLGSEAR